jgi:hypothetical protein
MGTAANPVSPLEYRDFNARVREGIRHCEAGNPGTNDDDSLGVSDDAGGNVTIAIVVEIIAGRIIVTSSEPMGCYHGGSH